MTKMMMTKNWLQDAFRFRQRARRRLGAGQRQVRASRMRSSSGMSFLKTHMLCSGSLAEEAGDGGGGRQGQQEEESDA